MELLNLIKVTVFLTLILLSHGQEKIEDSIDSVDDLNLIQKAGSKSRKFFDFQTRVAAYKDLNESRCLLEKLKSWESFLGQDYQSPFESLSKNFFLSENQLSKRQIYAIGGARIYDFCRGFPTFLIQEFKTNSPELYNNTIGDEGSLRAKRSTKHYFVGRVRGQTQSQYLNFGNNKDPGKAEAESTYGSSKAVVSGTSGMGQAQSQSSPYGCDECYGQATGGGSEQEQLLQFARPGQSSGVFPPAQINIGHGGVGTTDYLPGQKPSPQGVGGASHEGPRYPPIGPGQGISGQHPGTSQESDLSSRYPEHGGPRYTRPIQQGHVVTIPGQLRPQAQVYPGSDQVQQPGTAERPTYPISPDGHLLTYPTQQYIPTPGHAGDSLIVEQPPQQQPVYRPQNGRPTGPVRQQLGKPGYNGPTGISQQPGHAGPTGPSQHPSYIGPGGTPQQVGYPGSVGTLQQPGHPGTVGTLQPGDTSPAETPQQPSYGTQQTPGQLAPLQPTYGRPGSSIDITSRPEEQHIISPSGQKPVTSEYYAPGKTHTTITDASSRGGQFSGQLAGDFNSHGGQRGRFSGVFSGQYEAEGYGAGRGTYYQPPLVSGTAGQTQNGRQPGYDRGQFPIGNHRVTGYPTGPSGQQQPTYLQKPDATSQRYPSQTIHESPLSQGQLSTIPATQYIPGHDSTTITSDGPQYSSTHGIQQVPIGYDRTPGSQYGAGLDQYGRQEFIPGSNIPTSQFGVDQSGQQFIPGYGPAGSISVPQYSDDTSRPKVGPNYASGPAISSGQISQQGIGTETGGRPGPGSWQTSGRPYGPPISAEPVTIVDSQHMGPPGSTSQYGIRIDGQGSPSYGVNYGQVGSPGYGPGVQSGLPSYALTDGQGIRGYPTGQERIPGETGVPGQLIGGETFEGQGGLEDDADSQVQTSVQQTNNETQASASAQGKYAGGTAQSQVSGTYAGSGSFSASAGSDDGKRGALTQVSGGKEGALSAAQGRGGRGQSQAQVQLSSDTGDTVSSAQTSGVAHGSQTQVQASGKGGMADAQSNGPGSTSSQAQIGFTPYDENEKDDQTVPFRGGGMASAQSGTYNGQAQSQIQGKFQYGIRYIGAAQAGSGGKDAVASARNQTRPTGLSGTFPEFKPITFTSGKPSVQNQQIAQTRQRKTHSTDSVQPSGQESVMDIVTSQPDVDVADTEDYPDEEYDYTSDVSTEKSKTVISQKSSHQNQHIVLDPLEDLDATVHQSSNGLLKDGTILQPGQYIPGSPGYQIPLGFRGKVKSISYGPNTYTTGKNSQAQTVTLTPGTGRIIYKQPVYAVSSKTQQQNGRIGYGSGYTYKPITYQVKSGKSLPNFVSVTRSETGSKDPVTGEKIPSVYYTQSSSCGLFTNTCIFNGSGKLCVPKPKTNPDGSLMSC